MLPGHRCAGGPDRPSGHTEACSLFPPPTQHLPCNDASLDVTCLPQDFRGPCKHHSSLGGREPEAGDDLQSHQDPTDPVQSRFDAPPDNLFTRGPFYQGTSETHDEYRNWGGHFQHKKFNKHVRHYEEPGLKFDRSIAQTDFSPPHTISAKSRTSIRQAPESVTPRTVQSKNFHAKEFERRSSEPRVYFVDREPKWDFSTETSENYVCYQRPKQKNQLKDLKPVKDEIFLERVARESHGCCPFGLPDEFCCDAGTCGRKALAKKEQCTDTDRKSWLLYPMSYSFPNGYLILPSDSRHQRKE